VREVEGGEAVGREINSTYESSEAAELYPPAQTEGVGTLKKQVPIMIAMLSLLLTLAIADSATAAVGLKANIPFEFTVGKDKLPAGQYTVESSIARGHLLIRAEDRSKSVFASFFGGRSSGKPSRSKLVFNRYGSQYFLSQVWNEGSTVAMQLPKSRAERELAKQTKHLAQNRAESETVVVLAQ
jgi:hypothetical protein